jgi:hypothetical protein
LRIVRIAYRRPCVAMTSVPPRATGRRPGGARAARSSIPSSPSGDVSRIFRCTACSAGAR